MKNTPHFESGTEKKIAFVFSCPGRYEEINCKPAAKTTGKNLEILMNIINKKLNTNDFKRGKVMITNSWPTVEYPEKTGRSEATKKEILNINNLNRLGKELKDITKIIIGCGKKAELAVKILNENNIFQKKTKIIFIPHLGMMSLNTLIKKDISGKNIKIGDPLGTYKRIERLSEIIIDAIIYKKIFFNNSHSSYL